MFESEEAQDIARAIGQAFQVAYREFLKANGIEDHSFLKEVDYQEVLASQEIFNDELTLFSSDDKQREVVVVKGKVKRGRGGGEEDECLGNISRLER